MKLTRVSTCVMIGALILGAVLPASAQAPKVPSLGITLGLKVTSLGFGPEVGFQFAPRLGIRGGFQGVSVNREITASNILYAGSVKWSSFDAILDLHAAGPLRLSAGIMRNGNRLELTADPVNNTTIGGTTYTPSQIGTVSGKIDFKKAAPYLGIGLVSGGRIGFIFELGAMLQGSPKVSYTATTSLTGVAKTQFDAEVANEAAQLQADLDDRSYLKTWPVVGIGLQLKI